MLVFDALIAAHNDSLVWIKLGKFFQQLQKFLRTLLLTIDDDVPFAAILITT